MPVTIICPRLTCRAMLRVPDETRGKRVRCAECGVTLLVPKVSNDPPPPPKPKEQKPQPSQPD